MLTRTEANQVLAAIAAMQAIKLNGSLVVPLAEVLKVLGAFTEGQPEGSLDGTRLTFTWPQPGGRS